MLLISALKKNIKTSWSPGNQTLKWGFQPIHHKDAILKTPCRKDKVTVGASRRYLWRPIGWGEAGMMSWWYPAEGTICGGERFWKCIGDKSTTLRIHKKLRLDSDKIQSRYDIHFCLWSLQKHRKVTPKTTTTTMDGVAVQQIPAGVAGKTEQLNTTMLGHEVVVAESIWIHRTESTRDDSFFRIEGCNHKCWPITIQHLSLWALTAGDVICTLDFQWQRRLDDFWTPALSMQETHLLWSALSWNLNMWSVK